MRQISFAHTKPQILDGSKDVTRRYGWTFVRVGELLQGIEKGQGIPKGGHVATLRQIRVVSARREKLSRLLEEPDYGADEMRREGFPGENPQCFIDSYFRSASDVVTRIEFEYVDEGTRT